MKMSNVRKKEYSSPKIVLQSIRLHPICTMSVPYLGDDEGSGTAE